MRRLWLTQKNQHILSQFHHIYFAVVSNGKRLSENFLLPPFFCLRVIQRSHSLFSLHIDDRYKNNILLSVHPYFVKRPENVSAVSGQEIRLSCVAGGRPQPEVRWSRMSGVLPASRTLVLDSKVLTIRHANPDDQDTYVCTAENPAGSLQATAHVQVNCK